MAEQEPNRVARPLVSVPGGAGAFARAVGTAEALVSNLETVVRGKREEIRLVVCALASQGHVLFDDVPGTAKTVLARAIAGSIEGAEASRIQCTPDLQPSDVTGLSVYDQRTRDFDFRAGPIFANVVLVDEINRATQKTQSALLEAMAEGQVTVDGVTRPLPDPFLLLATENPIEHEGTFFLPEAQLDRFLLRTSLGYPGDDDELRIVLDQRHGHPLAELEPCVSLDDVRGLQRAVEGVYVDPLIQRWVVEPRSRDARAADRRARGVGTRQPRARANRACVGALRGARPRRARRRRVALRPGGRPSGALLAGLRRRVTGAGP